MDTGRLRSSGKIEYSGFFGFRPKAVVRFDVNYAEFVNDGTRPHIIRPKRAHTLRRSSRGVVKPALRFRVGGQVVYARVVHHPGTRGTRFLDRALRDVLRPLGWDITNQF